MKKLLLIPGMLCLLNSCCQKEPGDAMTVVKDCTGDYLRFGEKDYHVCNMGALASYKNGSKVMARFKKLRSCDAVKDRFVCELYHANEGWVEVISVR